MVKKMASSPNVVISANSTYSAEKFLSTYGFEAGVIRPNVSSKEFAKKETDREEGAWKEVEDLPEPPWVVTIGGFNWAKGIWECISMLKGSEVGLAIIGRGSDEDLYALREHAKSCEVELWAFSDLDLSQLIATMRRSRAVISMAHGEPFGLTAIDAGTSHQNGFLTRCLATFRLGLFRRFCVIFASRNQIAGYTKYAFDYCCHTASKHASNTPQTQPLLTR